MLQSSQDDAASEPDLDLESNDQHDVTPPGDPEGRSPELMHPTFQKGAPHNEHDPFLSDAEAGVAMHRFTGAFVDPAHEEAFAANFFRISLPFHMILILLFIAIVIYMEFRVVPALRLLWISIFASAALFAICRVLLHFMKDAASGQRIGSRVWTVAFSMCMIADVYFDVIRKENTCVPTNEQFLVRQLKLIRTFPLPRVPPNPHPHPHSHQAPLQLIAGALLNGSLGMSMLHKTTLIGLLIFDAIVVVVFCGGPALGVAACQGGVVVVGASVAHMAELYLRRVYMEKVRSDEDRRRLEERNEQLKAEKERLQYDVQRKGHVINDDERSAIRRGLQAVRLPRGGGSEASYRSHGVHRSVSEAGGPTPSDAPPPSLPPGAPSSAGTSSLAPSSVPDSDSRPAAGPATDSDSRPAPRPDNAIWHIPPPLTWEEADRQFYAERAHQAAILAAMPAKRERERPGDGRGAAAHIQPYQAGATAPPISWSDADRGDLRQFLVYPVLEQLPVYPVLEQTAAMLVEMAPAAALCSSTMPLCGHARSDGSQGAAAPRPFTAPLCGRAPPHLTEQGAALQMGVKRSGSMGAGLSSLAAPLCGRAPPTLTEQGAAPQVGEKRSGSEETAALSSIAASLRGSAPPVLTEQGGAPEMAATKAAPCSPTKVSRKPHRSHSRAGSSGPAPAAEPAVSELLFPTAELVLAEVMKSEQAEMAAMTQMVELVDDEVVESIADQMSDMFDDEVVATLSQHMAQDHLG
jgi:hypothetical protein